MKHLKHNVMAAFLLAAAALMCVGCDKENDNPSGGNDTPDTPQAKISRVYRTSATLVERYNESTEAWDTLMFLPGNRHVLLEMFWKGDRIDSVATLSVYFSLHYDSDGRLSTIDGQGDLGVFARNTAIGYDAQGRIQHVDVTNIDEGGDTLYGEQHDYLWAGGILNSIENRVTHTGDTYDPHGTREDSRLFTWAGGNITSSVRHEIHFGGTDTTYTYNYEYASTPNPLCGITYLQLLHKTIFYGFDPVEGFCKKLPSRIYNDNIDRTYEYTLSGDRITAVHEVFASTNGGNRYTAIADYEIEYVEEN